MTVAAGPGFVVEMVNLAESVWRTGSGTPQLVQTRDLAVLFGSNRDRLTDPRVLYDAKSGRWFASISDVDSKDILLAVSTGADPTGTWTVSPFDASACADQPRLGIADDIVVLTADLFDDCDARGARALGSEIWTVNKAQLLAGSTTPAFSAFGPTPEYSSVAPVQSLSPTATEYAVSVDDRVSRVVHLLAIDGVPPLPVTVREIATPAISLLARPPGSRPAADGRASTPDRDERQPHPRLRVGEREALVLGERALRARRRFDHPHVRPRRRARDRDALGDLGHGHRLSRARTSSSRRCGPTVTGTS